MMETQQTREATAIERMHNMAFRFNGTSSPGILPRRRAILSIIQTVRPTVFMDDVNTWRHFYRNGLEG